jgi:DNA-binding HxlR family transcriptional regulator
MYKYGQYCPIAKAVEVLGDRWTLLIVRDLLVGCHHFNDLERGLPGISRALLSNRLRRLQQCGLLEKHCGESGRGTEYRLTQAGQELWPVMNSLLVWGTRWSFGEPDGRDLDPRLLLWWMRSRICTDRLPQERIVIEFDFHGQRTGIYWLILTASDVSVCDTHPGFDVDVHVAADVAIFYKVWLGRLDFASAFEMQAITVDGIPSLVRGFTSWFALSPVSSTVRAITQERVAV